MAKPRRKWPRYTAMVLAVALLTISLALVLVEKFAPDQEYIPKSIVQIPSKVVAAILKPFQGGFAWASSGVSGYLASWKLSKNIEIEYNKLKSQNDELIYQSMYVKELEEENERLKRLYGVYEENISQSPLLASVISKETGNWFQKFTIDKGSDHKIKENMAVINEAGLIGYIDTVYETSADVISIIDSRAGVAGLIESSREQGIVRGTLGIDDEATCRMYYLPVDLVPRPGDVVVTSGIGAQFPKGIKIGEVRESTRYPEENKRYVVIEPSVDFQHIEEVLVLVYVPAVEDMPDANDGQISYVPQPLDTIRPSPVIGEEISDPNLGAITAPPRATRSGGTALDTPESSAPPVADGEDGTADPAAGEADQPHFGFETVPPPTPTPSPDPELDALMQEELEQEGIG